MQYNGISLGYSFNRTGEALEMTARDPVYLKCAPQSDGSAIIDEDNPIVQALPTTADGKIYIFLGFAESDTAITLYYWHPVYYYKDGAIRVWTNAEAGGTSDEALTTSEIQSIWNGVFGAPLISFTIDTGSITSYQAVSGMTWEQWVESDYNTGGYVVDSEYSRVCDASNHADAIGLSGNMVNPSDAIIDSTVYFVDEYPLIPPIPDIPD